MGDERTCLVNDESRQRYGSFFTIEHGRRLYHHITPEWWVHSYLLFLIYVNCSFVSSYLSYLFLQFFLILSFITSSFSPFLIYFLVYFYLALQPDSGFCIGFPNPFRTCSRTVWVYGRRRAHVSHYTCRHNPWHDQTIARILSSQNNVDSLSNESCRVTNKDVEHLYTKVPEVPLLLAGVICDLYSYKSPAIFSVRMTRLWAKVCPNIKCQTTSVVIKSSVFWNITSCSPLNINTRFGRTSLHNQGCHRPF
jgi:hypothetical protein